MITNLGNGNAEADQIHEARIAACMKDPQEVEHYHRLLENGRDKFLISGSGKLLSG